MIRINEDMKKWINREDNLEKVMDSFESFFKKKKKEYISYSIPFVREGLVKYGNEIGYKDIFYTDKEKEDYYNRLKNNFRGYLDRGDYKFWDCLINFRINYLRLEEKGIKCFGFIEDYNNKNWMKDVGWIRSSDESEEKYLRRLIDIFECEYEGKYKSIKLFNDNLKKLKDGFISRRFKEIIREMIKDGWGKDMDKDYFEYIRSEEKYEFNKRIEEYWNGKGKLYFRNIEFEFYNFISKFRNEYKRVCWFDLE